jgi:hypothetical protein
MSVPYLNRRRDVSNNKTKYCCNERRKRSMTYNPNRPKLASTAPPRIGRITEGKSVGNGPCVRCAMITRGNIFPKVHTTKSVNSISPKCGGTDLSERVKRTEFEDVIHNQHMVM